MDHSLTSILTAFSLTLFAGLATSVGSAIAFFSRRTNPVMLCVSLGFSAGVMIYVSFVEIFQKANESLLVSFSEKYAAIITAAAFFAGIGLTALIDALVPSEENPHEAQGLEDLAASIDLNRTSLLRMGLFSALAIGIHNFPEGFATFTASLQDPSLGLAIAIAIAIHNIPEGIAVSVPVYYATGSRKKAFWLSTFSGFSEPLGAIIGYVILRQFMNETVFGITFAMVAGIMIYISLDELLPTAEKYGKHHFAIGGLISGMGVMAGSLLLFM
ncbi:zinc transporter ZupT [Sedimentisphaera salicampi]|uniref:Zinc transporter ZupT n=1 Tax=Sedimentisphaera salicampi TaxID=1941349 RepID=A0A1W6LN60_9BACT|nr:zinc transporter ZupT [Sedimentisphaera salicampi]ARN57173.1 Zinc transporter ZupT [Sedimentisphaera salicampi]OXU14730.1 Zinc transporter ZupT [Sedimentisphaera salicampi]